jgi:hypothetical protein
VSRLEKVCAKVSTEGLIASIQRPRAATRAQYEKQLSAQAQTFGAEKLALDIQRAENARRTAELDVAAKRQEQDVALAVQTQVAQPLAKDRKAIAEQELIRTRQQVESEGMAFGCPASVASCQRIADEHR